MKSAALMKKGDGVGRLTRCSTRIKRYHNELFSRSAKICRWCLSADALEAVTRDDFGQYKLQKIFDFTSLQINFLPGVPSYLCAMCEAGLKKMDRFRWRCNEKNDMVNRFIKQQNTAKKESEITQDHLDPSAEQTVGTELSIKTKVTSPDEAKDLHLNQKSCTVHQANSTYECYNNEPDDLFEAEENPIAIKLENEDVDGQNVVLEQDNPESHRQKRKHHCSQCSSRFAHLSSLKIHIRTHTGERPHVCKVCKKAFHSSTILAKHLKIHNKDQQHKCPHCSSMFAQLSNLKTHIRTHTDERPYVCKICARTFRSRSTLTEHTSIHFEEEYYQCSHCPAKFALSKSLRNHIRTHTGERPYKCKVCDTTFRTSSNLANHSKIHNRDQHHQCPHCSSMFAQLSSLKIHIRTHTGERPYQCRVCDKGFRSSSGLGDHSKIHKKA